MTILDYFEQRQAKLSSDSRLSGMSIQFGRSTDDRPKHSAWLHLQGRRPGSILVWDSGEADLEAGFAGGAGLDVAEHYESVDTHALDELLERLITLVTSDE